MSSTASPFSSLAVILSALIWFSSILSTVQGISSVAHFDAQNLTLGNLLVTSDSSAVLVGSTTHIHRLGSVSLTVESSLEISEPNRLLLQIGNNTGVGGDILSCQQSSCMLVNSTNLNTANVQDPSPSSVLFPANEKVFGIYTGGQDFFVTKDQTGDFSSSISKLSYSSSGSQLQLNLVGKQQEESVFTQRILLTTFHRNIYVYYVFVVRSSNRLQVARVCADDSGLTDGGVRSLTTYTEAELQCAELTQPEIFTAATFVQYGEEPMILVSMGRSNTENIICAFNVSEINMRMDDKLTNCKNGIGQIRLIRETRASCPTGLSPDQINAITPCNRPGSISPPLEVDAPTQGSRLAYTSKLFSLRSLMYQNILYLFAGTNGSIDQFYFSSESSLIFIRNISLVGTLSINDIQFSPDSESLYALTSNYVRKRPVNVCSDYTSCDSCVQSADPACGWCTLSNLCTKLDDCMTSPRLWQTNSSECPSINSASPIVIYTDELLTNSLPVLTLNVSNIPGVAYYCVYMFGTTGIVSISTATIDGLNETVTCPLPPSNELPRFTNEDTILAVVSLRTSSGVDVISLSPEQRIAFTNCSIMTSCSSCLSTQQACNWCPLDNRCISPRQSCQSSLSGSTFDNCPLIQPPNRTDTSDYLVHVDIPQSLIIQARNLDLYDSSNYNVHCILRNQQGVILYSLEGTVNGFSVSCREATFNVSLDPVTNLFESTLEVQVTDSSSVLIVENLNNSQVIFYSCPLMGENCGQCLSIEPKFDCGYCSSLGTDECIQSMLSPCSQSALVGIDAINRCQRPVILKFSPSAGPISGNTIITMDGTNLGANVNQISNIDIGGVNCRHLHERYEPGRRIVCTTERTITGIVNAKINVTFTYGRVFALSTNQFQFLTFRLNDVPAKPNVGPLSGGTMVTISGTNLGIGSSRYITLAGNECIIKNKENITADTQNVTCLSQSSNGVTVRGQGVVNFDIDGHTVFSEGFDYEDDPQFFGIEPKFYFPAGGTIFTISGRDFDTIQSPRLLIYVTYQSSVTEEINSTVCTDRQDRQMNCTAPPININSTHPLSSITDVYIGLLMDNVTSLRVLSNETLDIYQDPVFDNTVMYELSPGERRNITIEGNYFQFMKSQINVQVDAISCEVNNITNATVTCELEIPSTAKGNDQYQINVEVGNINGPAGTVIIRNSPNLFVYLVPAFIGFVILLIVIFIVMLSVFYRKYKQKDEQNDRLLFELERLESSVAYECKLGFAELQTDLGELIGDLTGTRLPYHDLHTYILQSLFPGSKDHPTLHPPQLPAHSKSRTEAGIRQFYALLMDKIVLLNIVHTLEAQRQFNIRDKSNFGSLLMIALHDKLDYATEILKRLLSDLVRRTVAESYPKLLLRRTESVGEKMLSSWLAFTLHGYVVEHTGQPLYLLYKAVKAQLEKGPIDVITGEARYSLSEQKLIRQQLDIQVINAIMETEDGLQVPVKLIDCDSISQAKEKMLDAVYKNAPVSQRPPLLSIDIEYRRSPKECLILRDEDGTNVSEYGWRKINTLRHYRVNSDRAVFRLVPRQDTAGPGKVFDYTGSLMVSHGHRTRTLSDGEDGTRIWHLFKQVDEDPRSSPFMSKKMVTEIYLPRMLSTKSILQQFVDDLFESIFTLSHPPTSPSHLYTPVVPNPIGQVTYAPGSDSLPLAIKYIFDLLDDEAMCAKINDSDVIHTWKNNSLALRFWVNLIKNPEFVFDINKSAIVDACLSVIAQAFIDGCSYSDTRPTINSPTSKLLYNKEVQGYKNSVKLFYEEIQSLPRIPEEMMMQHLREMSAHHAELFRKSKQEFNIDSAVYEILRYAIKYQEPILQSLRASGLEAKAQIFESVLQYTM